MMPHIKAYAKYDVAFVWQMAIMRWHNCGETLCHATSHLFSANMSAAPSKPRCGLRISCTCGVAETMMRRPRRQTSSWASASIFYSHFYEESIFSRKSLVPRELLVGWQLEGALWACPYQSFYIYLKMASHNLAAGFSWCRARARVGISTLIASREPPRRCFSALYFMTRRSFCLVMLIEALVSTPRRRRI